MWTGCTYHTPYYASERKNGLSLRTSSTPKNTLSRLDARTSCAAKSREFHLLASSARASKRANKRQQQKSTKPATKRRQRSSQPPTPPSVREQNNTRNPHPSFTRFFTTPEGVSLPTLLVTAENEGPSKQLDRQAAVRPRPPAAIFKEFCIN